MTETEEFEFRHRLEQEQAAASSSKTVQATPPLIQPPSDEPKTAQESPSIFDFLTGSPRKGHEQSGIAKLAQKAVGAGETALAFGTGIVGGSLGGAASTVNNAVKHIGYGLMGEDTRTLPNFEQAYGEGANAMTYQPRTTAGKEMTSDASDFLAQHAPALIAAAPELAIAGRSAAPAARFVGSKVAQAATPTISPAMATMVGKAADLGIDLRPDQVSPNKYLKVAGEISSNVPGSGSKTAAQQQAFNSALMKQIDPEATTTTFTRDEFAKALDKSGSTIGQIAEKAEVPLSGPMQQQLMNHLKEVSTETPEVRAVNEAWVKKIGDAGGEDGVIPGAALRKLDSQIGRQLKSTPDGDLRRTLIDLHEVMMDGLANNLGPEDMAAFKAARKQYAIGKAIEPVVAKEGYTGNFPPAQLMARMTATKNAKQFMAAGQGGEIGDLADVGQLLKEPRSSLTAERGMVQRILNPLAAGGLGGAAAVTHPVATAAGAGVTYGAANLYNRLGPTLTRAMAEKSRMQQPSPASPSLASVAEEPSLELGFASKAAPSAPASPLGDLTPNWSTSPGAAAPSQAGTPIDASGLYRAVGEPAPTTGTRATRAKPQQPVVPGRPDLPETMISGPLKQTAGDSATGAAMQLPEVQLAIKKMRFEKAAQAAENVAAKTKDPAQKAAILARAKELRDAVK